MLSDHAWCWIAQSVCQRAFSLLEIRFQRPSGFESCIQQSKTTCLISIRISLARARASKLKTTNKKHIVTPALAACGHILSFGDLTKYGHPVPRPDLTVRNCQLSAEGVTVKASLVCSNSTVFLRISWLYFSQHCELIRPMNLRDAHMHHGPGSSLTQVMAWCVLGAKPLPEPILIYNHLYP